jgi:hypothetical protein
MKKPALIFILTVLSGSSSLIQAEDLVTKTGKTYADVVVTQSDDSTIRITFKEGVARLNLADLPVEWQQRYHYDPVKAAAHQAAREKEKKAQMEARQAALKLQAAARESQTGPSQRPDSQTCGRRASGTNERGNGHVRRSETAARQGECGRHLENDRIADLPRFRRRQQ